MTEQIQTVKKWLKNAKRIAVLTGAGISTDSGIPDFRGPQGLWTLNPPAEELSNIKHYVSDAEIRKAAWKDPVFRTISEAEPNDAHRALVRLGAEGKHVTVITQNIDGLHRAAGSDHVLEIHGCNKYSRCIDCGRGYTTTKILERVDAGEEDPGCLDCDGGIIKRDVVFFGEDLDPIVWSQATNAAINCDVFLAIGTSLGVWPAADLPDVAKQWGKPVVIINQGPTDRDYLANVVLEGNAADILKELIDEV